MMSRDGTSPPACASLASLSLVSLAARAVLEHGDARLVDDFSALVASARAATRWCGSCDRRRFECEFAADEWRRAAGWDPSARNWPDDDIYYNPYPRQMYATDVPPGARAQRNSDAEWEALYVGAWRRCLACEAKGTVLHRAPTPRARFETAADACEDEPGPSPEPPSNDVDDDDSVDEYDDGIDDDDTTSAAGVLALTRARRVWTGLDSPLDALVRLFGAHPGNCTFDGFALELLDAALARAVDSVLLEVLDAVAETAVCHVASEEAGGESEAVDESDDSDVECGDDSDEASSEDDDGGTFDSAEARRLDVAMSLALTRKVALMKKFDYRSRYLSSLLLGRTHEDAKKEICETVDRLNDEISALGRGAEEEEDPPYIASDEDTESEAARCDSSSLCPSCGRTCRCGDTVAPLRTMAWSEEEDGGAASDDASDDDCIPTKFYTCGICETEYRERYI